MIGYAEALCFYSLRPLALPFKVLQLPFVTFSLCPKLVVPCFLSEALSLLLVLTSMYISKALRTDYQVNHVSHEKVSRLSYGKMKSFSVPSFCEVL